MINISVVRREAPSGAAIWNLEPSGTLCLGAAESNMEEQLQVSLPPEWADYTVRMTFIPRNRAAVGVILPESGIIDITADMTCGVMGMGSFVLDAVQGDRAAYTVGGRYEVYGHPKAGGTLQQSTPSEYQQILSAIAAGMVKITELDQAKLDKPSAPPSAGKVLKVLSVNDDGTFVCEWADAFPNNGKEGQLLGQTAGGLAWVDPPQSGVQSDWNQNDETASDYIKNRPFYDKSLVSVPFPESPVMFWYKVSDSVPTGDHSEGAYCCSVFSGGKSNGQIILSTDDYYATTEFLIVVALKDNAVLEGITFPGKGTYFLAGEGLPIVTGFALGRDADPEITWDGSTGEIKTLDEKFIPDVSGLIVKSSTPGSTKKFKITVNDDGTLSTSEVAN